MLAALAFKSDHLTVNIEKTKKRMQVVSYCIWLYHWSGCICQAKVLSKILLRKGIPFEPPKKNLKLEKVLTRFTQQVCGLEPQPHQAGQ